jgi:hypothetical protein
LSGFGGQAAAGGCGEQFGVAQAGERAQLVGVVEHG